MKISKSTCVCLSAFAFALTLSSVRQTDAQVLISGRTAADNAASAGGRAPGDLASAGVGRALQAARDGRAIHPITETQNTSPGPRGQFAASAGNALVTQLFDFFFFFVDRFLARAGLSSIFPAQLQPPATGGSAGNAPGSGSGTTPTTGGGDTTGTGTGDTSGTGVTTGTGDTSTGGTGAAPQTGSGDIRGTGIGTPAGTGNTTGTDITVDTGTPSAPGGIGTNGGRRPVRKTDASTGR